MLTQEKSRYNQRIAYYMDVEGLSRDKAVQLARRDMILDLGTAAPGGGLSGFVTGGAKASYGGAIGTNDANIVISIQNAAATAEQSIEQPGSQENHINHSVWPSDNSQLKHIFRQKEGHLTDTFENRQILESIIDEKYKLGSDKYGNIWYAKTCADGSQIWVRMRNNCIINGGINQTALVYNPITGLNSNPK
jgi:hypothetical protein